MGPHMKRIMATMKFHKKNAKFFKMTPKNKKTEGEKDITSYKIERRIIVDEKLRKSNFPRRFRARKTGV